MPGHRPRAGLPSTRAAFPASAVPLVLAAAIAILALAAPGCGELDSLAPPPAPTGLVAPSATPAPASAGRLGGTWAQDLAFSGDVSGRMTVIAANGPGQVSQCTGRNSRISGTWASTITGPVGDQVYGLLYTLNNYRGPGTYAANLVVQLHSLDNARVWQNTATDPVKVTVDPDEESGTINARLTELNAAKTAVQVTGRWSCRT